MSFCSVEKLGSAFFREASWLQKESGLTSFVQFKSRVCSRFLKGSRTAGVSFVNGTIEQESLFISSPQVNKSSLSLMEGSETENLMARSWKKETLHSSKSTNRPKNVPTGAQQVF